jgi:tetratricopeptide (TPR) repeat protein
MCVHVRLLVAVLAFSAIPTLAAAQRGGGDSAALVKAGAQALEERRFDEAHSAFVEASRLSPRDAEACLGAGMASFMLGQYPEAEQWLERALTLDPRLWPASLWLGQLQYRNGRIKDAIATYEAALKRSPGLAELEDVVRDWRKESDLQGRFYESRGAHFSVLFEGPADDAMARRIVERLEAAYWRVGSALNAYPPRAITVVLYTTEQFRDITRLPEWTAAAYDGRIRVPIRGALQQLDALDGVLTHEFVHAVVAMLGGPNVPVWLNEGLATVFEPDGAEDAAKTLARASRRPSLAQLHDSFFNLSSAAAQVAYAVSTRAVQRMIELRGAPAVVALLQDVARGAEFRTAFHQRIAMRFEDFDAMVTR